MHLTREPLDVEQLLAGVAGPERGGSCVFVGTVRAEPDGVTAIEYSAYDVMAEAELERMIAEARARWPEARVAARHRIGLVPVGEASIVIASAAPHRAEAFEACRYVIEEVKRRLPVWKKEHHRD
jgi:molybdopterin synthase catalytic subunit